MAAVAPHKRQCNLGSFAPARSSVKPPLHKAASTLPASIKNIRVIFPAKKVFHKYFEISKNFNL